MWNAIGCQVMQHCTGGEGQAPSWKLPWMRECVGSNVGCSLYVVGEEDEGGVVKHEGSEGGEEVGECADRLVVGMGGITHPGECGGVVRVGKEDPTSWRHGEM